MHSCYILLYIFEIGFLISLIFVFNLIKPSPHAQMWTREGQKNSTVPTSCHVPVCKATYAPYPLTGASVGIISILLHMRLLLGPRRRRGREERRRCEEEAADLISFSPSLIMASYCSDVETACGLRESSSSQTETKM